MGLTLNIDTLHIHKLVQEYFDANGETNGVLENVSVPFADELEKARGAGNARVCTVIQNPGGSLAKTNPKLTALNAKLAQVGAEIEKLLNTLTGASAVFRYPAPTAELRNWTQNGNRGQKRLPT